MSDNFFEELEEEISFGKTGQKPTPIEKPKLPEVSEKREVKAEESLPVPTPRSPNVIAPSLST